MISSLKRNKKASQTHLRPILPLQLKRGKDAVLLSLLPSIYMCLAFSASCAWSEKAGANKGSPGRRRGQRNPLSLRTGRVPPKTRAADLRGPAFPGQRAPAVINVAVTASLLGILLSADGNTVLRKA